MTLDLTALEAARDAATPGLTNGKASAKVLAEIILKGVEAQTYQAKDARGYSPDEDAALIVLAINSLPALIAAARERDALREGLLAVIEVANSFCDESGDEVAAQVKIRVRAALAKGNAS